jgi:hypothetical protein
VRDFQQHHDEVFEQLLAVTQERDRLKAENKVLRGMVERGERQ